MSRLRNLGLKIATVLIACLVTLIFLEIVLRIAHIDDTGFKLIKMKQEYFLITKNNHYWGTTYIPNANTDIDQTGREKETHIIHFATVPIPGFEQYGMRDDGINTTAKKIIPVLGDSFTWGATVEREEIWLEQIEERNPKTDLTNLGQSAGIAQAVAMYKTIEPKFPEHEIVIYAMWLGNEFLDNFAFSEVNIAEVKDTENNLYRQRWYYPIIMSSKAAYIFYKMYYVTNIPVKNFFASLISKKEYAFDNDTQSIDYLPENANYYDEKFGNFNLNPNNQIGLRYADVENKDQAYTKGIAVTEKAMKELKELTEKKQRKLIIIVLPFKEQVYYNLIKDKVAFKVDPRQPNKLIAEMCKKIEVTCIDITDELSKEKDKKLYWDEDVHFTPLGQKEASIVIEKRLKAEGVL